MLSDSGTQSRQPTLSFHPATRLGAFLSRPLLTLNLSLPLPFFLPRAQTTPSSPPYNPPTSPNVPFSLLHYPPNYLHQSNHTYSLDNSLLPTTISSHPIPPPLPIMPTSRPQIDLIIMPTPISNTRFILQVYLGLIFMCLYTFPIFFALYIIEDALYARHLLQQDLLNCQNIHPRAVPYDYNATAAEIQGAIDTAYVFSSPFDK